MPTKSWLGTFFTRNGLFVGSYILAAVLAWIFLMIILPQIAMIDFSFSYDLPPSQQGGPEDVYTLSPTTAISCSAIPAIPTATTVSTSPCSGEH